MIQIRERNGRTIGIRKDRNSIAFKENREAAYNLVICLLCSFMKGVPFWLKAFERVTILFFDLEVKPIFLMSSSIDFVEF